MPARKVPNEIKARRGTLRKDRLPATPLNTTIAPLTTITVPAELTPVGAEVWSKVLDHAGAWIGTSDQHALFMLCKAYESYLELDARVKAEGPVLYTDKGYAYAHPAVGMKNSAEDNVRKWMNHLGLTPADRTKLGVVMVETANKIDQFRARLQSRKDSHQSG